jgi:hypothetical protein
MPNQSAQTVSGALEALTFDTTIFMCHHGLDETGEPTRECAGYEAARLVSKPRVKAYLAAALAAMPDGEVDPVRAEYVAFLERVDPSNRLDDYQRAALYAQAIEARRAETPAAPSPDESAVPQGMRPESGA